MYQSQPGQHAGYLLVRSSAEKPDSRWHFEGFYFLTELKDANMQSSIAKLDATAEVNDTIKQIIDKRLVRLFQTAKFYASFGDLRVFCNMIALDINWDNQRVVGLVIDRFVAGRTAYLADENVPPMPPVCSPMNRILCGLVDDFIAFRNTRPLGVSPARKAYILHIRHVWRQAIKKGFQAILDDPPQIPTPDSVPEESDDDDQPVSHDAAVNVVNVQAPSTPTAAAAVDTALEDSTSPLHPGMTNIDSAGSNPGQQESPEPPSPVLNERLMNARSSTDVRFSRIFRAANFSGWDHPTTSSELGEPFEHITSSPHLPVLPSANTDLNASKDTPSPERGYFYSVLKGIFNIPSEGTGPDTSQSALARGQGYDPVASILETAEEGQMFNSACPTQPRPSDSDMVSSPPRSVPATIDRDGPLDFSDLEGPMMSVMDVLNGHHHSEMSAGSQEKLMQALTATREALEHLREYKESL